MTSQSKESSVVYPDLQTLSASDNVCTVGNLDASQAPAPTPKGHGHLALVPEAHKRLSVDLNSLCVSLSGLSSTASSPKAMSRNSTVIESGSVTLVVVPVHVSVSRTHFFVVLSGCILLFGEFYCYGLPAALNVPLRSLLGSSYSTFQWQLNLLYTIYSIPNLLMPLIGGALYDRFGARVMLLTFSALVVLGSGLFWAGVALHSFPLLLVGRLFCGLGSESLEVVGTSIMTIWFQGTGYLSLALGTTLSTASLATAIQVFVTPAIITQIPPDLSKWILEWTTGPALASLVGLILCIISVVAALALTRPQMLHASSPESTQYAIGTRHSMASHHEQGRKSERSSHDHPDIHQARVPSLPSSPQLRPSTGSSSDNSMTVVGTRRESSNANANVFLIPSIRIQSASDDAGSYSSGTAARPSQDSSVLGRKSFSSGLLSISKSIHSLAESDRISICTSAHRPPIVILPHHVPLPPSPASSPKSSNVSQSSVGSRKSILQLGSSFWIVCVLAILLYGSVMPFINIASDFIQSKWYPGDLQQAGALMSLPDLLCAILTPILGLVADKIGGQPTRLLPISGMLLTVAHMLLFFTTLPPAPSLVLLGMGTATFLATLWPTVSMLVPDALLGTALGAVQVAVNAALAGVPLLVAGLNGGEGASAFGVEGGVGMEVEGEGGKGSVRTGMDADQWIKVGGLFVGMSAAAAVVAASLVCKDWVEARRLTASNESTLSVANRSDMHGGQVANHEVVAVCVVGDGKQSPAVGSSSSATTSPLSAESGNGGVVQRRGILIDGGGDCGQ